MIIIQGGKGWLWVWEVLMLYSQTLAEQRKAVPDNSKVRPHYVRLTNCFGKDRIPKPDLAEVRGLELVSPALRENMYLLFYSGHPSLEP